MKSLGLILIYGAVFLNVIFPAGAVTTIDPTATPEPETCNPGVAFTKISLTDITVSWNKTCFNDATSYTFDLIVTDHDDCTNVPVQCEEGSLCETTLTDMVCGSYVLPCYKVTMHVTGGGESISISNHLAPLIKSTEWQLEEKSFINNETKMLNATWGPPDDSTSEFVTCATKAKVAATCLGVDNDEGIWEVKDNLDYGQGSTELNIADCLGDVTLTVTYMAENVTTETKKSIQLVYKPDIQTTLWTTDGASTTDIPPERKSSHLSGGEIAGIVIGCLAVALLIGGVAFCYIKKKLCFKA